MVNDGEISKDEIKSGNSDLSLDESSEIKELTNKVNKMSISSVFKKTCYKCGNLGHHADNCEHKQKLCYNCKQPGHESSNCPEGKKNDIKQCYYCKQIGHIQAECTNTKPINKKKNKKKNKIHYQKPLNYVRLTQPVQYIYPYQVISYYQRPLITPHFALEVMKQRSRSHDSNSHRCYTCGAVGHNSKDCYLRHRK